MTSYRVKFFMNLLSSDGHHFKCLQRTVDIHDARSVDEAIQAAWLQYERLTHAAGRVHGTEVEVESIFGDESSLQPSQEPTDPPALQLPAHGAMTD